MGKYLPETGTGLSLQLLQVGVEGQVVIGGKYQAAWNGIALGVGFCGEDQETGEMDAGKSS